MIKQALAMGSLQKAGAGDEGDGFGDDANDDAMHVKARLLLVHALKEEDEAVQGDKKTKRKKPPGTYRWRFDFETRRMVKKFIPDPAPPPKPKSFRPLLLLRSAFSPLFPQIFTNPRLLHDFFLAPRLLSASPSGDVAALALTCKAFVCLQLKGDDTVVFTSQQRSKLLNPAWFIASLTAPESASVLTTLHIGECALNSAELCYALGDVFAQGLPVLRELKFDGIKSYSDSRQDNMEKAFNQTLIKLVNSAHLPALRTLVLKKMCLEDKTWKAMLAALPMPKPSKMTIEGQACVAAVQDPLSSTLPSTTAPALCPSTPLTQLEHLVLDRIWSVKPRYLHAFFDCLAYHHVPLQTLECSSVYNRCFKAGVSMYQVLAAHLKFGNFPALTSLTIYEYMMEESSAAALIDGLNKGCRAVTFLSLRSEGRPPDSAERGLLLKALSQATEGGLEGLRGP